MKLPPNMALQRTRRPRIRSGRSLCSLGSPLNARPLGALKRGIIILIIAIARPQSVDADPAVRLVIRSPADDPLHFSWIAVRSGQVLDLEFGAVDQAGQVDTGFTGTVEFSSTDPFATLPETFVLSPENRGAAYLRQSLVLRTVGVQSITVRDSLNRILPGTFTVTVLHAAFSPAIPLISPGAKVLLFVGLLISGLWLTVR